MSFLSIRSILQKVVGETKQPITIGGVQTDGSDASIKIATDGAVEMGVKTSTSDAPVTGYITIHDINGNPIKLAVID